MRLDKIIIETTTGGALEGDVNGDGVVNVTDLLTVIVNWS